MGSKSRVGALGSVAGSDDGCEVNFTNSATHCGSCANSCAAQGFSGGFACKGAVCGCTNRAGCFNLSTDAQNCGACGKACATGQTCSGGACVGGADAGRDSGTDAGVDSGSDAASEAGDAGAG